MTEVRIDKGRVELPSGEWGVVPEQNRRERGHTFYPPFEDLAKIPALYATDGQAVEEKTIYLHYFTGGSDWYIAELDPKTGMAFGWARVNYPSGEWGYVNLIELEELCIAPRAVSQGGRLVGIYPQILVERDLHFTPTLARDCLPDDY